MSSDGELRPGRRACAAPGAAAGIVMLACSAFQNGVNTLKSPPDPVFSANGSTSSEPLKLCASTPILLERRLDPLVDLPGRAVAPVPVDGLCAGLLRPAPRSTVSAAPLRRISLPPLAAIRSERFRSDLSSHQRLAPPRRPRLRGSIHQECRQEQAVVRSRALQRERGCPPGAGRPETSRGQGYRTMLLTRLDRLRLTTQPGRKRISRRPWPLRKPASPRA